MRARRSITLQLTLLFAASSTLILLAVGGTLAVLVDEHFQMEDVADLEARAVAAGRALGPDAPGVVNATPDMAIPPALLAARPRSANGLGTSPPQTWKAGTRSFRGITHVVEANGARVTLVAAADISHHVAFMAVVRRALWVSVLLGIASSVPLGWLAARRGIASMHQVTRLAAGVSAERLTQRLPLDQVPLELHPLAQAFNEMLARLEDSFRRLSDFSSDLAHELRTPITNVMTQTQVALSAARGADDYREVLYSNLEEFQRLARIVEEMLFLASSEHALELPEKIPIDLATESDALVEFFEALADERGVRFVRTGNATALGDRLMVRRAIANLVSNALRHTAAGQVVTIAIDSAGESARLAVENPGADIPAEHLPRLFDRFYRVDRSRGNGGAGLGLAITRAIALAHGGAIEVSSAGGRTRFTLLLPMTKL